MSELLSTQLGAPGEGSPEMEQAAKTVCDFAKSKLVEDTLKNLAYGTNAVQAHGGA